MAMELKHLNPQHVMDVTGKAIDEISRLRAENAELEQNLSEIQSQKMQLEDDVALLRRNNAELKAKLEDAQASAYAESVDAGMRERKLKRALCLARANRALEKIAWFKLWNASISTMDPEDGARQEYDKWKKNLGKFLAKAEEL